MDSHLHLLKLLKCIVNYVNAKIFKLIGVKLKFIFLDAVSKCWNVMQLGEEYYTKVHPEFQSAYDYYHSFDCYDYFKDVDVPTLIIHSKNDPTGSPEWYPWEDILKKPNYMGALTPKGAHLSFMTSYKATRVLYFILLILVV